MATRKINFGFLVCLLIIAFEGQTLSRARRTDRTRDRLTRSQTKNIARKQKQQALERHKQQLEKLKKQRGFGKSEKELMEQVLRATEEQWKAIKPKLDKVRSLKNRADVSIRMMGVGVMSGGSGIGGSSVGVKKGFGRGSEDHKECPGDNNIQYRYNQKADDRQAEGPAGSDDIL